MGGLANAAWASAKSHRHHSTSLLGELTWVAEQCVGDSNKQGLSMTLWAVSRREGLKDAWSLFDHTIQCTPKTSSFHPEDLNETMLGKPGHPAPRATPSLQRPTHSTQGHPWSITAFPVEPKSPVV